MSAGWRQKADGGGSVNVCSGCWKAWYCGTNVGVMVSYRWARSWGWAKMGMLVIDANPNEWDQAVGRRTRGPVANRSPSLAEAVA